jgi:hypothetical protein
MSTSPPKYIKGTSFSGGGYNSVGQILTPIDSELVNIQSAINATEDRLAEIQRDDGKLQNGIVTRDALAANMVFSGTDIQLGSVTQFNLATGAATTNIIADTAVTTAKLADGAVTTAKLNDGSVTNAKLASGAIGLNDVTGLNTALSGKQPAGSYATLVGGTVPTNQLPTYAAVATSGSYTDLTNKPTIPSAQVNSDWNASSGVTQILNKPTLGTAAAQNTTAFDAAGAASTAQSYAIQRANHTGTQTASTISDFATTVLGTVLTGLSTATNAAIAATDSALVAFGKLQAQVSALASAGYQTASQVSSAITSALSSATFALSKLTQSGATTGQVPKWNGTAWVPGTVSAGYDQSLNTTDDVNFNSANLANGGLTVTDIGYGGFAVDPVVGTARITTECSINPNNLGGLYTSGGNIYLDQNFYVPQGEIYFGGNSTGWPTQYKLDTYGNGSFGYVTADVYKGNAYTVSTLVANYHPSGVPGGRAYVTDATSNVFGATAVGGGSYHMPVWSDGTNWRIG